MMILANPVSQSLTFIQITKTAEIIQSHASPVASCIFHLTIHYFLAIIIKLELS